MNLLSNNFLKGSEIRSTYTTGSFSVLYDNNPYTIWSTTCTGGFLLETHFNDQRSGNLLLSIRNHNMNYFIIAMFAGGGDPTIITVKSTGTANTLIEVPNMSSLSYFQLGLYEQSATAYIGDLSFAMYKSSFNVDSNNFTQSNRSVGIQRTMSDGGLINIRTNKKYSANINLTYVPTSTMENLYELWSSNDELTFITAPSALTASAHSSVSFSLPTNWDGKQYNVIWVGDFSANWKDNNIGAGYTLPISLMETPDD